MEFQKLLPIESVKNVDELFPALVSEKFDGVFCCFCLDKEGNTQILSRTGKKYTSMKHIEDTLVKYLQHPDDKILFEAYADEEQPIISGWCRDTILQHRELRAYVHRIVFSDNHQQLTSVEMFDNSVYMVPHTVIYNYDDLMKYAEQVWSRGGEGLVVTPIATSDTYRPGVRNKTCVKVKQKVTYDVLVTGLKEGKGKYEGMVGALECKFANGTRITCGGMSDAQREIWWDSPDGIVGYIVEVEAMKSSIKGVLREPRFKRVRYDKDMPDLGVGL